MIFNRKKTKLKKIVYQLSNGETYTLHAGNEEDNKTVSSLFDEYRTKGLVGWVRLSEFKILNLANVVIVSIEDYEE